MNSSARQVLSLDAGWRFHRGDIDSPVPTDKHIAAYMANKAGWARGPARATFDDSDWRVVDLPHDWSVEGPIEKTNYLDNGFLPRGIGWYRRYFVLGEADRGKYLALRFDGVSSHCTVFVNGHLLHRHFCGYTSFAIDISDVARHGEDEINTLAVRVDATPIEGWWYEGAGIYRHTWLIKSHALHVAENGVFVRPQRGADGTWDTQVETTIENASYLAQDCLLVATIMQADGQTVDLDRRLLSVEARSSVTVRQNLPVRAPALWSVDSPALYTLRTELHVAGALGDEVTTTFGYRTIRFDPDRGFFLNEQPLKLKGTCNHQDHAGVGVAVPDSIQNWRIRRLKEMGCNAYRAAHNPPAPQLLDACDRLGMLVMDENRTFGSSPEHLSQLRSMVLRDRNHPSVILWSICNEEAIQGTPAGAGIARAMQAEVKRLDSSRSVTASVSGGILNDDCIADVIEVMSINYQLPLHDAYHAKHPRTPLVAGETHCVLATRGVYQTDSSRFAFSQDDSEKASWGQTARETWRFVSQRPFIAGLFAWTGFDYRGEPSPHGWPCVNSHFGIMDTCGFEKDAFFLHKAFFNRQPFVKLSPHWNWPGREGQMIAVTAYTNCESAELFLNGESLGRQAIDPIDMTRWMVPYRPGVLKAISYRDEGAIAAEVVETTGPAVGLGLEIHSAFSPTATGEGRGEGALWIPADGHFAIPVTVFALDKGSRRVPTADNHVTFTIEGPARILGVGNGDATCHEPDKASERSLFHGLAQVIVQTTTTAGAITLTASAPGLKSAKLEMSSSPIAPRPNLPPATPRHFVTDWRMSPITATRPDVAQQIQDSDMNTWERVEPGTPPKQWASAAGYAIYRATVTPTRRFQSHGGTIVLRELAGRAEIFRDAVHAATKADPKPQALEIEIPPAQGPLTLSVLIHADAPPAGLGGKVELLSK